MSKTHGLYGTTEYKIYHDILKRCRNPNHKSYERYGAKGIKMCERWLYGEGGMSGVECFVADMGIRPSAQHTVDRYPDQRGDYSPDNCRWATWEEQQNNRTNNRLLEFQGTVRTISEWSAVTGITKKALWRRICSGWSIERTLTQPMRQHPARSRSRVT